MENDLYSLASRFEEMDALLVFHNVFIPWDKVFIYQSVEAGNQLYPKTGIGHQPAHQSGVRGLVKLSFAAEVAMKLADSIGVDGFKCTKPVSRAYARCRNDTCSPASS